jgi:phytoene/squalene synthetase
MAFRSTVRGRITPGRSPHCPRATGARSPGLMMAAIYRALLDEIERDGYRVLDRRIGLTPLAKAWIAWKTSWSY